MAYDAGRFKALVLYVLWRTGHYEGFGITKLNKVLWFSEARSFEAYGRPITGETFIRDKYGPRSKHLLAVCRELEDEGLVSPFTEPLYDHEAKRFRALEPADTSKFSAEELSLIDWWISNVAEKHTATSISKLSHDYGWEIANLGEELPVHAFLASRIREPASEDELAWASEEAKRLGSK